MQGGEVKPTLGTRVQQVRRQLGMTQADLAKSSGLSVTFISEIENDHRNPSAVSLHGLADALGDVSLDYLVTGGAKARAGSPVEGWTPIVWRRYIKVTSERSHWYSHISVWEQAHGWHGVGFGEPGLRCESYPSLAKAVERADELAEQLGGGWE